LDQQYISNYATINIKTSSPRGRRGRHHRVRRARLFDAVWLDPAKVQARGLTAADVVTALRAANVQVAAAHQSASATSQSGFELAVQTLGRLSTPSSSATSSWPPTRTAGDAVRDIGRVELGSQDYTTNAYLDNQVATASDLPRPVRTRSRPPRPCSRRWMSSPRAFRRAWRTAWLQHDRIHPAVGRRVIKTLFEAIVLVVISSSCSCRLGVPPSFRSSPSRFR